MRRAGRAAPWPCGSGSGRRRLHADASRWGSRSRRRRRARRRSRPGSAAASGSPLLVAAPGCRRARPAVARPPGRARAASGSWRTSRCRRAFSRFLRAATMSVRFSSAVCDRAARCPPAIGSARGPVGRARCGSVQISRVVVREDRPACSASSASQQRGLGHDHALLAARHLGLGRHHVERRHGADAHLDLVLVEQLAGPGPGSCAAPPGCRSRR